MLRYNHVPDADMRARSDLSISNISYQFSEQKNKYAKWSKEWQEVIIGSKVKSWFEEYKRCGYI